MDFHVAVVLCGDNQTRERTVLSGVPIMAGPARPLATGLPGLAGGSGTG